MTTKIIKKIAKNTIDFVLNENNKQICDINKYKIYYNVNTIIIDFYNFYCNMIKFNKYKLFSLDTFCMCMDLLLKKFNNFNIWIVSKNIFEVDISYINEYTIKNKNVRYIIVEDSHIIKSQNLERDDYVCILFLYFLSKKGDNVRILSNDNYRNYKAILKNIKPITINTIENGNNEKMFLNDYTLKKHNENILKVFPTITHKFNFKFIYDK